MKKQSTHILIALAVVFCVIVLAFSPIPDMLAQAEIVEVTIAEAKAAKVGTTDIRVTGTVTNINGKNVTIEDQTGGINVYLTANAPNTLALGDNITVTGTRAVYKELIQLTGVDATDSGKFTVVSSGNELPLKQVSLYQLKNDDNGDIFDYMNERVVIKSVVIGEVVTTGNTSLTMGEYSINIYKCPELTGISAGDTVDVIAVVKTFNGYQFAVNTASDITAATAAVSVQSAKDAAVDTMQRVMGTVTYINGRNVYVEDATGAIVLYLNSNTVPGTLAVGDMVRATGKRATYKGLYELSGINGSDVSQFEIISSANVLPLQTVSISDLLADQTAGSYNYMCERIYIEEAVIGTINTSGNTALTQGESSINVYKIPALENITEGNVVNVIGVVGIFNSYQILVNSNDDVTLPAKVYTIKEARTFAIGTENITVNGIVTMIDGRNVVIEDETAGITLRMDSNSVPEALAIGDMVKAVGTLGEYNGLLQLAGVDGTLSEEFKILSTNNELPLTTVTIKQLLDDSQRAYQNRRVYIEKAYIGTIDTAANTALSDAEGNSINIYKIPEIEIDKNSLVNVTAVVGMFNTIQLRVINAADVVLAEVVVPTVSIQEAKDSAVDTMGITVKGVVTFIDGRNIYIEDNTGAIDLYLNSNTVPNTLAVGDMVRATGKRAAYKGLIELTGIDGSNEEQLVILSSDNELPLQEITLAALLADNTNEYLCERIIIKGLTLGTINTSGNTAVAYDGKSINIYKIPAIEIEEGATVNVTAIVGIYNSYQLRVAYASDIVEVQVFADPIGDEIIPAGAITIPEALAAASGASMTVVGQLVYRYGNYDSMNSAIIEDVVNGEVYALQVYNALSDFAIGDILAVTGTKSIYGQVPQLGSVTAVKLGDAQVIDAIVFDNFTELMAQKDYILSARILVKNLTLGTYSASGSTVVTDEDGVTMNIYRAATFPSGVAAGEVVNLYACFSRYNSTYQLRVGSQKDYAVGNDIKAPEVVYEDQLAAEVGQDYTVYVAASDNVGVVLVELTYFIGNYENKVEMTFNSVLNKYEYTIAGAEIFAGNSVMYLSFTAYDEVGNSGATRGTVEIIDLPQIISVDPAPNSSTYDVKRPTISVVYANAMESPIIALYIDDVLVSEAATYTPSEDMADGQYTAKVIVTRQDGKSVEYTWVFTIGEPQYQVYFGQIHSHTAEYSDGSGTLEDAFEYAMNQAANLDFLAVTDHSNYFDNSSNLGDMGDATKGKMNADGTMTLWQEAQATADYYNSLREDFVTLYGYEMTWSGQYGHMNTYNTDGFVSRNNSTYTVKNGPGLEAYYKLLTKYPEAISMFNHPGSTFGTFEDFGHYSTLYDQFITMIEVGNGEGAVRSSAYWDSYEYYQLALDKGWHLAPTNDQDNHKGKWGDANTARTCVITDNFTREGIYQAMRDMSIYASEDANLSVYYYLNDMLMGSILDETPDSVHIYARISDANISESLGKISVITSGGVVVWSQYYNSNTAVIDVELPCDYPYYYLRIDQADKDIAVTAPVWTGSVTKVGITSIEKDTLVDVKNETTTFTTTLFNNEESDLVVNKVVYKVDDTKIKEFNDEFVVGQYSEYSIKFPYYVKYLGLQTFTVEITATLNGVAYAFVGNYEIDALLLTEIIDVAIDAGHNNFYVSGNYADSDANLIELFGGKGIRSYHITEELTYNALKKMKLLILTVPYGGWEDVSVDDLYTDAEIDAIAEYASKGGNIILCSKSDRGDPVDEQLKAYNISNRILEAIDAKARIANGIVVDNVIKSNEAYRISFTEEENFNYNNPITKDILKITNNTFSCYNGAPVIANGATPLVVGSSTTWGANYTANFGGSSSYVPNYETDEVVVPMGDVAVMTYEQLSGGGFLITSGVTFFSTFEVKVEVENATTLQNSNYQIVINIAEALQPEPVITDIEKVHESESGYKFTVEGIVTSNASGYDQNKAFFDCIYIQDNTAGINIFPVDGDFRIGQKVRVSGVTSAYNGEIQLKVSKIELVDASINPIAPKVITNGEFLSGDYLGSLVQLSGVVDSLIYTTSGVLDTIMVRDHTGLVARVFLDGYIMPDYTGLDTIKVGDIITAVGLSSITVDTEDPDGEYIYRLRVRDREEIMFATRDNAIANACAANSCASVSTGTTIAASLLALMLLAFATMLVLRKKRALDK
ncbi:MAG: hypothetical protein PHX51_00715 [Clostridia bacterium]|nr:hypothetical protein [Clostridia bacterium]